MGVSRGVGDRPFNSDRARLEKSPSVQKIIFTKMYFALPTGFG